MKFSVYELAAQERDGVIFRGDYDGDNATEALDSRVSRFIKHGPEFAEGQFILVDEDGRPHMRTVSIPNPLPLYVISLGL